MRGVFWVINVLLTFGLLTAVRFEAAVGNSSSSAILAYALIAFVGFNAVWLMRRVPGHVARSQPVRMFGLWMNAKEKELERRATDDARESRKPR